MTMPLRDFIDSVNVLLNMLGDGHTRCALPLDEAQRMARTVPLLPLDLAIEDTLLHVRAERMGFRSVAPGSRITPSTVCLPERCVRELLPLIVVDGKATAARVRRLEREFAVRFVARYGISTEYKLMQREPARCCGRSDAQCAHARGNGLGDGPSAGVVALAQHVV